MDKIHSTVIVVGDPRSHTLLSGGSYGTAGKLMKNGECRGASPFAESLRVSLRYQFPPFFTRKGANGMAEIVFQRPARQEALEKVNETAEVTMEGPKEMAQPVPRADGDRIGSVEVAVWWASVA